MRRSYLLELVVLHEDVEHVAQLVVGLDAGQQPDEQLEGPGLDVGRHALLHQVEHHLRPVQVARQREAVMRPHQQLHLQQQQHTHTQSDTTHDTRHRTRAHTSHS